LTEGYQVDARAVVHLSFLLFLCGVLFLPYLDDTPFYDKGEPREAMAVQDIIRRGEWLVPLKKATDIPSKPPLFHWSAALTSKITGRLDEVTIRFPSTFYAISGVIVLYFFVRKLYGGEAALLSAAILATTMIYANQALSARVDMTLCFFVTLNLVLFYSLCRGFLTRPVWYYVFYALVGLSTLAKGPLGIVLPGLVAGTFLVSTKRWDLLRRFTFHPGIVLTLVLGVSWYVVALLRGGEGFIDRQLLQENFERFFGGSGHSHPIYYYVPYFFSQGLPWSIFLPLVFWDWLRKDFWSDDHARFLSVWVGVMFLFFSVSAGKRPVYLLPLYPALSVLLARSILGQFAGVRPRLFYLRAIGVVAAAMAVLLVVITFGAVWSHDPEWFFTPLGAVLKSKDRANAEAVKDALATFGWSFMVVTLLSAVLWLALSRYLWAGKLKAAAFQLVLISILLAYVIRSAVMPAIAEAKSYRPFMNQVNERVETSDRLYIYGDSFNSDPVVFYRGGPIEVLKNLEPEVQRRKDKGPIYIIMSEKDWSAIRNRNPAIPNPLLTSKGTGPEGDTRLVLILS
jgi:4-amino-4-deoxy-L-arabinose transferase-like glycosyltransferase